MDECILPRQAGLNIADICISFFVSVSWDHGSYWGCRFSNLFQPTTSLNCFLMERDSPVSLFHFFSCINLVLIHETPSQSSLYKMHYSPIDPEQESQEGLLSGEHDLKQVDKSTKKWRQRLFTAFLAVGVGVACLTSGLVGYHWHRDMDGPCTQHISNFCEQDPYPSQFYTIIIITLTDNSSPSGA